MHPVRSSAAGAIAGAVALTALALAPAAHGALRATDITMTGRAASERIVITFAGGTLTGLERQVDAPDPQPGDGRATVRVNARGIGATATPASRGGVAVRIARRPGSIVAVATAAPGRFKFVSYRVSGDRRHLVVDLWRATTAPRARILDDGCLRLTSWRGGAAPRVRGLELVPLFEHTVVTSLREQDAGDTTVALRPRTAVGAVPRPDFSGLVRPGRWGGPLPHSVTGPRRVMLEAWSTSAKDGSLDCLVQVPVVIRP